VQLDLVGVDVALDLPEGRTQVLEAFDHSYLTSPSRSE
jgi:hypothetical protein